MTEFKIVNRKKLQLKDVFDDEPDFSDELSKNRIDSIEEIIEESLENTKREDHAGRYFIYLSCDIKN